jgi:hypothetical protein
VIRFTWLQFRTQAAGAAVALAIAAIALAVTGPHLAHLYTGSGIAACRARGICPGMDTGHLLSLAVIAIPAIIGLFWGAPLVAGELETRSYRLTWTQGVTRTRWLAVKLAVVGVASMAAAGLLSLMVTWWTSPIDQATADRWSALSQRDLIPVGSAAFAFALGVTAGLLIRRTLPAMAVTLAVFTLSQFAMTAAGPHLVTPLRTTTAVTTASLRSTGFTGAGRLMVVPAPVSIPGAWILSPAQQCTGTAGCNVITATGQSAASLPATKACVTAGTGQACDAYIATLHLRQAISYQPAGRYWIFQWYETAIYLALSLILTAICFLDIRRRIT